jgi:nitrate/TMAO reductase-like tetraheme cytochrome c subunit
VVFGNEKTTQEVNKTSECSICHRFWDLDITSKAIRLDMVLERKEAVSSKQERVDRLLVVFHLDLASKLSADLG